MTLDKPNQIEGFRLNTLLKGMELERTGMKLTRGPSCLSIVKREFGLKGNREKVIDQFKRLIMDHHKQS